MDQIWVSSPKGRWTQTQKAQNNEFVESGLENQARMSWMANKVGLSDKNIKINGFQLKKVVIGEVQGDQFLYFYLKCD